MSRKAFAENFTTVDVVYGATDEDLSDFHSFIKQKEQEKIGWDDGAFKVIIDPGIRVESLPDVLKRLEGGMKEVVRQELRSTGSDIYLFATRTMSKRDKARFINEASNISSYSQETCCSSKLKNDGLEGLLDHFFEDIVKSQAVPIVKMTSNIENKEDLIKKGAFLRKTFDNIQNGEITPEIKKKSVGICSCPECQTDEESSDEENDPQLQGIFYAAGIPSNKIKQPLFVTKSLSLSNLTNILMLSKTHYDGVTSPNMYVGRRHAFFTLHIEDMALWSINFHHFGHPKIWFVIPPDALLLLMFHLQHSGIMFGNSSCWNCLGHKTVFPSVNWLKARRIPFKIVIQEPGEAVILYPNAAHFGFSVGHNVGEAVNFATVSWLLEGINAPKCQCFKRQVHMDLSELIAAFRPDLLDKYLKREIIPTRSMSARAACLHKSVQNFKFEDSAPHTFSKQENNIWVKCPVQMCQRRYLVSNKRDMVSHVSKKHKPLVEKCKLLDRIEEGFQMAKKHI